MRNHQQDGAEAPGPVAPEPAHQDHVDLAPLGTTNSLPDVGASNDEALAGGAAQGSRGQKEAAASIVPDTDAADKARHPLSAAFGDMPAEEFAELVRDIKRNGLITTITAAEDGTILDGWHRYRACIEAGVKPRVERFSYMVEPANEDTGRKMTEAEFACAQNANRRHLTPAQRREIVATLLKADRTKSDRAIGGMAKVSHHTVAAVRGKAERSGQIAQTSERKYSDGRTLTKIAKRPSAPTVAVDPSPDSGGAHSVPVKATKTRGSGWVNVAAKDRERSAALLSGGAAAMRQAATAAKSGSVELAKLERARSKLQAAIKMLDELLAGAEVTP